MKREEFYGKLFEQLGSYSEEEKEEIREYYEELICDGTEAGISEDEVIGSLESPERIAEGLLKEYAGGKCSKTPEKKPEWNGHYQSKHPVTRLNVSARNRGFRIEKSTDNHVHILCETQEMDEIVCNENDGVFYFHHSTRRIFGFFHSVSIRNSVIVVQVPDCVEILEAATQNGSIHMENMKTVKVIELSSSNSGITGKSLEADELTMTTSNSGVTCQDIRAKDCTFRTSNSSISLSWVDAAHHLTAETSNASIDIAMIKADKMDLKTQNATIKGVIDGTASAYAICSHTTNGRNSLPASFNSDQEKKLFVSTTNGNIKVAFAGD